HVGSGSLRPGTVMTLDDHEWPSQHEVLFDPIHIADTDRRWGHRPCEVDMDKPSVSRVYDWYRGGAANFAPDRAFGQRVKAILPELHDIALYNCRFLARAVRFCAERGIRQFLDIGSGIPDV